MLIYVYIACICFLGQRWSKTILPLEFCIYLMEVSATNLNFCVWWCHRLDGIRAIGKDFKLLLYAVNNGRDPTCSNKEDKDTLTSYNSGMLLAHWCIKKSNNVVYNYINTYIIIGTGPIFLPVLLITDIFWNRILMQDFYFYISNFNLSKALE